jgi:hypothetical protein
VDEFVAELAPRPGEITLGDALADGGDVEAAMKTHSVLFEIFTDIRENKSLSWDWILLSANSISQDNGRGVHTIRNSYDYDTIIETYLDEASTAWNCAHVKATMLPSTAEYDCPRDPIALQKFRDQYGDVLTFPIPYDVDFPELWILYSFIRCHPVRFVGPAKLTRNQTSALDLSANKDQLVFVVDPAFSDDEIVERIRSHLSEHRTVRTKSRHRLDLFKRQFQSDSLFMKLMAYDHVQSLKQAKSGQGKPKLDGLGPDWRQFCLKFGILPARNVDGFINTVRMWPNLIEKKIRIFDLINP